MRLFYLISILGVSEISMSIRNTKSSENVFQKHGVSVYNSGPVRRVSIFYSVVITLNKPQLPDLTRWYLEFKTALNSEKSQFIPITEKKILFSRLNRLAMHNRIFDYARQKKTNKPDFLLKTFNPTFATIEMAPSSSTTTLSPKNPSTIQRQTSRAGIAGVRDHPDAGKPLQNDAPYQGSGEDPSPLRARRGINDQSLYDEQLLHYSNTSLKNLGSSFSNSQTLPEIDEKLTLTHKIRKKRGLINGVGKLFKILFGISTVSDIEHIKQAILQMQKNDLTLRHNQDQLVSTFNLTKVRISRLSEEMSILQKKFWLHSTILTKSDACF